VPTDDNEPATVKETPPETKAEKHSPAKIRAIQGVDESQPVSDKPLPKLEIKARKFTDQKCQDLKSHGLDVQDEKYINPDNLKNVSSGERGEIKDNRTTQQKELVEMNPDAMRRVMQKTVDSANDISDLDSKSARKNLYEKVAIGTLTEQLCFESTGSCNLNEAKANFPWADGATSSELQQIKSHINMSESAALSAYSKDLSNALGVGKDTKIDQAVETLWDMRNDENWNTFSAKLPPEVAFAESREDLKKAMMEKIVLRNPTEAVPKIREYVRKDAGQNPDKYGLQNPSDQDIDKLIERIKPATSDLSNHQLRLMARDIFQQKMELAGYPKGVAYAKHSRQ